MPYQAAAAAGGAITGIIGQKMSNKAQKKMQKRAIEAQERMAAQNNALAWANVDRAGQYLDPYAVGGMQAGNVLMQALGLAPFVGPGSPGAGGGGALDAWQPPTAQQQLDYIISGSSDVLGDERRGKVLRKNGTPEEKLAYAKTLLNSTERMAYDTYMATEGKPPPYAALQGSPTGTNPDGSPITPQSALDVFKNSVNYDFLYDEGMRAVNNNWGSDFESPAAAMAMQQRGVDVAHTQAIGPWMEMLARQQGVGVGAANNMVNTGTASTNAVMGIGSNLANNQSNMYGAQGQMAGNMWGAVAEGFGDTASALANWKSPPPSGTGPSGYSMSAEDAARLNASYGSGYGG